MIKIGLITALLPQEQLSPFHYLLLHLNKIQSFFELELIDITIEDSTLLKKIHQDGEFNDEAHEHELKKFKNDCNDYLKQQKQKFPTLTTKSEFPEYFIIYLSEHPIAGNFYYSGINSCAILSLYNWNNIYAPPSLLEYFLTLTIQASLNFMFSRFYIDNLEHYETRGCLFDFNRDLASLRFKVLDGYICSSCIQGIKMGLGNESTDRLKQEIEFILSYKWLGDEELPLSVSSISRKLGFVLFHTEKFKQTMLEVIKERLIEQVGRQPVIIFGAIITVALIGLFGRIFTSQENSDQTKNSSVNIIRHESLKL